MEYKLSEILVTNTTLPVETPSHPIQTSMDFWWIPQVEIPFLIIIMLVGIIGNISIIGAIVLEKKLSFIGNAFIINLAVADLIVTAYVIPGVLANVIANDNLFPKTFCKFTAVVVSVSCSASIYSLTCIAINRYVAVARSYLYTTIFTKRNVSFFIAGVWAWSLIISLPPAFGWGDYKYHPKMHICMYDCNTMQLSYTSSFITLSVFLPFFITCLCYWSVFRVFNNSRKRVRSMSGDHGRSIGFSSSQTVDGVVRRLKSKNSAKRELNERRLVVTLFSAVILFTVCWLPYALIVMIHHDAPAFYKKSTAWLALTNSAMNSILYGVLNRNFKNGYIKLWSRAFYCCKKTEKVAQESASTKSNLFYSRTHQYRDTNVVSTPGIASVDRTSALHTPYQSIAEV